MIKPPEDTLKATTSRTGPSRSNQSQNDPLRCLSSVNIDTMLSPQGTTLTKDTWLKLLTLLYMWIHLWTWAIPLPERKQLFSSFSFPKSFYLTQSTDWAREMGFSSDHKILVVCNEFLGPKSPGKLSTLKPTIFTILPSCLIIWFVIFENL